MFKYSLNRLRRAPVPAVGVMLLAIVLAVVLCGLEQANQAERKKYAETYRTIPVTFTVCNLSGTKTTDLNISEWPFAQVFTQDEALGGYVSDLQLVCRHAITGYYEGSILEGITSTALSPELWPDNGATITWDEGFDESIFASGEALCLVPDGLPTETDAETGQRYVELEFSYWKDIGDTRQHSCRFTVAGTYMGGDGQSIYCPYTVCKGVFETLDEYFVLQAIQATLADNQDLEALRAEAAKWFAQPNPLGEKTPCQFSLIGASYFPFALDINDELLQRASATLENSIATNRVCAVLVLCLSAAAGLLIGFLMVRARKREIALLRTVGTPNRAIFLSFGLEQLLCFAVGIGLGGAYNQWQPGQQLVLLVAIFAIGLTAALLIFLNKNLMTTIKEDE